MKVLVVGSGASGVHFALSALRKGHDVRMLDVGYRGREQPNPADSLTALKETLPDPVGYFLGDDFGSVILPGNKGEYYGFPPGKEYIFRRPHPDRSRADGFSPLVSFARGGLAETWTGGAYPFNDAELQAFPFGYAELAPHYAEVAARVGILGDPGDDLARFFPTPGRLADPLRLDEHSAALMAGYAKKRDYFNRKLGCFVGRSRLAVLSADRPGRDGCRYCGRCLWGCPRGSLYTPSMTLAECKAYPNFTYRPDTFVTHLVTDGRRVTGAACEAVGSGEPFDLSADAVVLAAGTLMSTQIFLRSLWAATGSAPRLTGLMDNRQVMVPFINLGMLGRKYEQDSYQYHQLAMGFEGATPRDYVHCQVTTLKTALVHPLIQGPPLGLTTAVYLFRHLRAALGLVNVNLADTRRAENAVWLEPDPGGGPPRLAVRYAPPTGEPADLKAALKKVRRALRALGCVVPPGMVHVRPMGASVHYAGTVPMSAEPRPLTASPECRSHDFDNLYFVDGTTFPFLPAKNLTYTLMANAVRVADLAF